MYFCASVTTALSEAVRGRAAGRRSAAGAVQPGGGGGAAPSRRTSWSCVRVEEAGLDLADPGLDLRSLRPRHLLGGVGRRGPAAAGDEVVDGALLGGVLGVLQRLAGGARAAAPCPWSAGRPPSTARGPARPARPARWPARGRRRRRWRRSAAASSPSDEVAGRQRARQDRRRPAPSRTRSPGGRRRRRRSRPAPRRPPRPAPRCGAARAPAAAGSAARFMRPSRSAAATPTTRSAGSTHPSAAAGTTRSPGRAARARSTSGSLPVW